VLGVTAFCAAPMALRLWRATATAHSLTSIPTARASRASHATLTPLADYKVQGAGGWDGPCAVTPENERCDPGGRARRRRQRKTDARRCDVRASWRAVRRSVLDRVSSPLSRWRDSSPLSRWRDSLALSRWRLAASQSLA
jgi:hypothetical protein